MLKINLFTRNNIVNIILTLTAVIICVVLLIGPFQRGLFFDLELLPVQALIFFLFVLWCVALVLGRRAGTFMQTPLHWCFFALVLFYAISIPDAVHVRAAVGEFLRVAMYFAVFLMVFDIVRLKKEYIHLFLYALLFSAVVTALGGLGAAAGSWEIHGAYVGGRLESSLQYANTAAAYFMAGYFLALGLSTSLGKRCLRPVMLVPSTILLVAIFLTYSRGVWLLMPLLALLMLVLTGKGERASLLIYMFVTVGCCFPFLPGIGRTLEGGQSENIWLYLLAAVALAMMGGFAVEYARRTSGSLKILFYGLLVLVVLIGGTFSLLSELKAPHDGSALRGEVNGPLESEQQLESVAPYRVALSRVLPESVYYGIFSREESVGLRFAHYRDALKIIRDYPLLGTGGGGWKALYTGYQDQFYVAREVHSHFLQVWVEAGVFAFIAFCGIWILFAVQNFRFFLSAKECAAKKKLQVRIFLSVVALVLHSALDFNLSYGIVNIFLYTLLGVGAGIIFDELKPMSTSRGRTGWIGGMVGATAGTVLLIFTLNLWSGYAAAQQAISYLDKQQYEGAAAYFGQAIQKDRLQASNYLNLARVYEHFATREEDDDERELLRNDALTLAAGAYELEPYNPTFNMEYGAMLFRRGFEEEGLYFVERLPEINPYRVEHFVYVAMARLTAAEQLLDNDEMKKEMEQEGAKILLGSVFELEREMGRYHGDTSVLNFYLGKAAFLQGELEQALDYFVQVKESDVNYGESQIYLKQTMEGVLGAKLRDDS